MNEAEKEPWEMDDGVFRDEPDVVLTVYDLEERTVKFGGAVIDLCALDSVGTAHESSDRINSRAAAGASVATMERPMMRCRRRTSPRP